MENSDVFARNCAFLAIFYELSQGPFLLVTVELGVLSF